MTRRMTIAILIAMFAALVNWNSAAAATIKTEKHNVFVADFEAGYYYAALQHVDGDSYRAIKFAAVNGTTFEDMIGMGNIDAMLTMDDRGYTGKMTMHSTEYDQDIEFAYTDLDDSDIGTIANLSTHDGITDGTVNGDYAQFTGFVTNGSMYLLREANAYSVNGTGWIVQNGNLISYVVGNGEENPNQQDTHKVLLSVILF